MPVRYALNSHSGYVVCSKVSPRYTGLPSAFGHTIGRCTVWQVPHCSELAIAGSCSGSVPSAWRIGAVSGSGNGPYTVCGGLTRKLPVKVRAKPSRFPRSTFSACWRARMHSFCFCAAKVAVCAGVSAVR